jgi:hypothetical protein
VKKKLIETGKVCEETETGKVPYVNKKMTEAVKVCEEKVDSKREVM